jgi:protein-S-isoprenylcysteine O-methyltransferase Ste14
VTGSRSGFIFAGQVDDGEMIMTLSLVEAIIRWSGGVLAFSTLAIVLVGVWRGTQRKAGRKTGRTGSWLSSPWLYFASVLFFFGICYLCWSPLPWKILSQAGVWKLALGSLLYFPGMTFVLWGRLALGKNYFVSTGFGAQLFAGHQLVTDGPFAIVRHPMYSGLVLAALGALLIYSTWTTLLFVCFAPLTCVRARHEETALAAEFGEKWQEYRRRVPAFFPRLW